jgi:hypothetical protein
MASKQVKAISQHFIKAISLIIFICSITDTILCAKISTGPLHALHGASAPHIIVVAS